MFFGLFLGTLIKKILPEKRTITLIKFFIPIGIILFITGHYIKTYFLDNFWVVHPKVNYGIIIYQIGFVMFCIGIISFIYTKTSKLSFYFALFGKRALMVYVIHLLLLYGSPWWPSIAHLYPQSLSLELTILAVIIIFILTFSIVYLYEYLLNTSPLFQKYYKKTLIITIAFLLLIGNFCRF